MWIEWVVCVVHVYWGEVGMVLVDFEEDLVKFTLSRCIYSYMLCLLWIERKMYCDYAMYCCKFCCNKRTCCVNNTFFFFVSLVWLMLCQQYVFFLCQPCLAEVLSVKALATKSQMSTALWSSTREKCRGFDYACVTLTLF